MIYGHISSTRLWISERGAMEPPTMCIQRAGVDPFSPEKETFSPKWIYPFVELDCLTPVTTNRSPSYYLQYRRQEQPATSHQ